MRGEGFRWSMYGLRPGQEQVPPIQAPARQKIKAFATAPDQAATRIRMLARIVDADERGANLNEGQPPEGGLGLVLVARKTRLIRLPGSMSQKR